MRFGTLDLQLPTAHRPTSSAATAPSPVRPCVCMTGNLCGAALKSGDIGFAESYIDGHWSSPDLARC